MAEIKLNHDGSLDIATGRSRKEMHWRNRETTWSAFLNKIKNTHRTAEKLAEYKSEKKSRQDEIKDVGGFVGGYVNGGRRKADNITHRQMITLDIDFAKADIWDDFSMLYGCAAAVYSTHKHSPENPRLRLIIPIDRPVGRDEYVAISRRIAGDIGIDVFDDTTFEPERLMYWPSTSKDGEYVFHYQDGPWLDADAVLGSYKNWKDSSEWPVSDRAGAVLSRDIKKQGDPLEKPGIVGAYCRTYTVTDVLESVLSDVYDPCDIDNRYTFKEGSTAAGLVVYEDKFTYSHHGTDPTSGKLCNAFDLVRIHLFGLKDEDSKQGTPTNKLPSYTAMMDYASKDGKVRQQLGAEKLEAAREEFAGLQDAEDDQEIDTEWMKLLDADKKGNFKSTVFNVKHILGNDQNLKGRFAKNLFENREIVLKDLPWRKVDPKNPYMTDTDDAGVREYMEKVYEITGVQKIEDALRLIIEENSFHPVRDYLNRLVWDGTFRVETLFIDYLGVEDSPYTRATTRKSLTAAVKRVFQPGCKFDYVYVTIGKQGIGKSTILRKLGRNWFSDSFSTVSGKEAYEQIQGVWIVEMAELAQLKRAELEAVKHFITKQEDRFRVAYGKRVENFPRQCVFFGTDNNKDFLRDPTGNRRFWPQVTHATEPAKDFDKDLTDHEVDQIWAEAVTLYKAGEKLYLDKKLEDEARKRQAEHTEMDDREGIIRDFIDIPIPENWYEKDRLERRNYYLTDESMREAGTWFREKISVAEIWYECFGNKPSEMTRFNTKDIHNIMKNMENWENSKHPVETKGYGRQRVYKRKNIGKHEPPILVNTSKHERPF